MKINIDPKKELFRWGPIDGKLIYPDFFNVVFTFYPNYFYSWPDVLWVLYRPNKMICILDYVNLRKSGRQNFNKFILNDKNFNKYYSLWHKDLKNFFDFQKKISPAAINELSGPELASVYEKWVKMYLNFWTIGELPELANWGGEDILKTILEKIIPKKELPSVFERLSAPEDLSFYQKAELDLLKLKEFKGNKILFEKKLEAHQQNYFWILNSYFNTKVLSKEYFEKELTSYSGERAAKRILELELWPMKVKREKRKIIAKYGINRQTAKIALRLSFCIWWQDLRKYHIFLANHNIDLFLKEFSRRYKVNFDDLHYYNVFETLDLAKKGKRIPSAEIRRRNSNLVIYYSEKRNLLKYISGKEAKKIILQYTKIAVDKKVSELNGLVVSQGKLVKAKVKILTSTADFGKIKKGEVLVAPMTSPDFIVAIKKASAIVTDEGGMTCHAAIVSRELGIPCIVNTKIATKVLKDGDLVVVDTSQGLVRKIG